MFAYKKYEFSTTFRSAWVPHLKCNICPRYRKLGALLQQPLSKYVRLPFGVSMSHCKMPLVLKPRFLRFYVPLRAASKRERVTNEISKDNLTSLTPLQACARQIPGTILHPQNLLWIGQFWVIISANISWYFGFRGKRKGGGVYDNGIYDMGYMRSCIYRTGDLWQLI